MKYTLTKNDIFVIDYMKEHYDMTPSFNEDGYYTYDIMSSPSFNQAKYTLPIKKCYCGKPVDTTSSDCVQFNLCKDHAMPKK